MSSQLTHERCSELLPGYLAGELEPGQHRLVQDHLAHCAQCSAERSGLGALRSSDESEGLTTDERVALRAAVLGAATSEPAGPTNSLRSGRARPGVADESDAVIVPLGHRGSRASLRSGRARPAGKYLGIAALLAILAVGSLFVFRGGGLGVTSSDDSGSAVGGGDGGLDSTEGSAAEEPAPQDAFRYSKDLHPRFQPDRGTISEGDLDRFGRQSSSALSDTVTSFETGSEENQSTEEEELYNRRAPENTLDRLATRAPMSLASDVTECGRTALDELGQPGLATYATTATLEGEDVVVIGFVTGARTPDRYAVFAFPRGDCTTILASTEGPLE